jgi:hypothetical protein
VRFYFRFLTHMDRPKPEYELLLVLTFVRIPHDFRTKTTILHGEGETLSEIFNFSVNFFIKF